MLEASDGDGVCFRKLESRLSNHLQGNAGGTHVAWRRLELQGDAKSPGWRSRVHRTAEGYSDRPFEECFSDFVKAWVTRNGGSCCCSFCDKGEDETSLFCSELVAAVYRGVGLVPKERDSNSYLPKDFSSASNALLVLEEAVLGCEMLVVLDRQDDSPLHIPMEVMPTISDAQRETMLQYLKNVQESLAASGGRQGWQAGGKLTEDEMIFNWRKSVKNAVGWRSNRHRCTSNNVLSHSQFNTLDCSTSPLKSDSIVIDIH